MSRKQGRAVIVGASRGLGLGLARAYLDRGWHVTATIRSRQGNPAVQALADRFGARLNVQRCDIVDDRDVAELAGSLSDAEAEVVFVNAGISNGPHEIVEALSPAALTELVITNALAPLKVIEALRRFVPENGVIAVMSSNLASVANNTEGGWEGYRASKAALNTLLRSYAARHSEDKHAYLAVSPGWVRTDMGGDEAPLDVSTSVEGILNMIETRRGTRGVAFVDFRNETIAW